MATLVLVLVAGVALFGLGYRLVFGELPLLKEYFIYLIYPPGPLPINPWSSLLFAAACLASWLVGWFSARNADADWEVRRVGWVVALFSLHLQLLSWPQSQQQHPQPHALSGALARIGLLPHVSLACPHLQQLLWRPWWDGFSTFGTANFSEAWAKGASYSRPMRLLRRSIANPNAVFSTFDRGQREI